MNMKFNFNSKKKRYFYFLVVFFIFGSFLLTRFWKNLIIPNGFHIDEAAVAYDAWSLANFGIDRNLKSWPVYLINFGTGQNVLYCYVLALLYKIFGFSQWLIRVPAVLFSFFILLFGMLLSLKLFRRQPVYSLLVGGLIVICPYFIMASRFGLESSLMVGMSTVFLYCFVHAVESKRYYWYFIAGLTGGLVLYTYAIAYLALPLFLLVAMIYEIRVRKFSLPRWLVLAVPLGILAFPLILEQYINAFDLEEIKLGIFTVTKLQGYRISEIGLPDWQNFINALRSTFIGDNLPYNSVPGYANLYYVTIPLAILGVLHSLVRLVRSVRKRELSLSVYPFFWFLTMLMVMSCVTDANTNKINGIFYAVIFLAVDGISVLLNMGKYWKQITSTTEKDQEMQIFKFQGLHCCTILAIICIVLYGIGFLRFGTYYFGGGYSAEYPILPYFDISVTEALEFLEEHPEYKHERTYMAEQPIWFAVSFPLSPYELRLDVNEYLLLDYYYCGSLDIPEEGNNYIVRDIYADYAQTLRDMGYTEMKFQNYSLFFQDEN